LGGVVGGQLGGQGKPLPRLEVEDSQIHLSKIGGPQIQYTQKALEMEIEGTMVVKCVVTIQGTVRECRVLKSLPYMDRAVIDALERTTYKPYVFQGQPREVDCTFRIRLQLPH
jgi:protein TonB